MTSTDWTRRLAIVSDEAGESFSESLDVCLPLGIRTFELRQLPGGRVPFVEPTAIDEVEELTERHQLDLIGLSPGFCKCKLDDPALNKEFDDGFPVAFELAHRLQITNLTVFTYSRAGDLDSEIPQAVFDHLGRAATLCQAEGISLRLENTAWCWGDTGANLAKLANAIDVDVTWDPGNSEAAGQAGWPDGYQAIRQRVAHVHCKNWTADDGCVDIEAGDTDWRGQIQALLADNYAGYFTVEPHRWDERAAATRRNAAQLLRLLQEANNGQH